jgi:hypothetical protein
VRLLDPSSDEGARAVEARAGEALRAARVVGGAKVTPGKGGTERAERAMEEARRRQQALGLGAERVEGVRGAEGARGAEGGGLEEWGAGGGGRERRESVFAEQVLDYNYNTVLVL